MNRRDMATHIEMVSTTDAMKIFDRCWNALDQAGMPFTCHWGQQGGHMPGPFQRYFDSNATSRRAVREAILTRAARHVFGAKPLGSVGGAGDDGAPARSVRSAARAAFSRLVLRCRSRGVRRLTRAVPKFGRHDVRRGEGPLTSRLVSGAVRVVAVSVVVFLAITCLKLGYFVLFLLPLGALAAVLLTRRQRAGYSPVWSSVVAIVGYCTATALVWSASIQNRDETRELKWEVLESPGNTGPEVRLHLGGGHFLYAHSSELADYLRSRHADTITVSLPVTRILGCFQSVGLPRIEGWGTVPFAGFGGSIGPGAWEDHWWCP